MPAVTVVKGGNAGLGDFAKHRAVWFASLLTFGQELFQHITTIVPHWRVCDEAWSLGDVQLVGIGVSRNYGGQVMVLPWDDETHQQIARLREQLEALSNRIIIVIDDRVSDVTMVTAMVAPIAVVAWSCRAELVSFLAKDAVD